MEARFEIAPISETLTVPIESGRFFDPLDDEYENAWALVLASLDIKPYGSYKVEECIEVWQDESLPQAFRDRALLTQAGSTNTREMLGIPSNSIIEKAFSTSHDSRSPIDMGPWIFKLIPDEKLPEACRWMDDAVAYHLEEDNNLLNEWYVLNWLSYKVETNQIDIDTFEAQLGRIDIKKASPDRKPGDSRSGLVYGRFPVIDDILHDHRPASEEMKAWATNHLQRWLDAQVNDEQDQLPAWYKDVRTPVGAELCVDVFGVDGSWPLIQKIGWEELISPDQFEYRFYSFVKKIESSEVLESFLEFSLVQSAVLDAKIGMYALTEQQQERARAIAQSTKNPELSAKLKELYYLGEQS